MICVPFLPPRKMHCTEIYSYSTRCFQVEVAISQKHIANSSRARLQCICVTLSRQLGIPWNSEALRGPSLFIRQQLNGFPVASKNRHVNVFAISISAVKIYNRPLAMLWVTRRWFVVTAIRHEALTLVSCWTSVCDAGPAWNKRKINVPRLLGHVSEPYGVTILLWHYKLHHSR